MTCNWTAVRETVCRESPAGKKVGSHLTILAILILSASACGQYQVTGYHTTALPPRRTGVVSDSAAGYQKLAVMHYPEAGDPLLRVRLMRNRVRNVEYEYPVRREAILKRKSKPIVAALPGIGIGAYIALSDSVSKLSLELGGAIAAISVWAAYEFDDLRPPETRYQYVGTDTKTLVKPEQYTSPAAGETLVSSTGVTLQTDANGVAVLRAPLGQYDAGVTVRQVSTGDAYVVRRIARQRVITEDWLGPTATALNVAGKTKTVLDIIRKLQELREGAATLAGTAGGLVVVLVVDVVTGIIVRAVVERLGIRSRTEHYYDWVVIETG